MHAIVGAGTGASPESGTRRHPGHHLVSTAPLFALSASCVDARGRLADWVDAWATRAGAGDLAYTLACRRDTGWCAIAVLAATTAS